MTTTPRESSKVTTGYVHVHTPCHICGQCILECEHRVRVESITTTSLPPYETIGITPEYLQNAAPKPPKSNLILDVIWAWLIKNGVEVSEEAKDELERKVKEVL